MPIFNISIVDSVETGTATEEHASMDAARASVIQSALRILHSGRTVQGKRRRVRDRRRCQLTRGALHCDG